MNDLDIETLLHAADTPRMRVDSGRVLAGGKHKVHRRRATVGGGLLAAAVAIGAVGALTVHRGTPVPAGPTTRTTTAPFFTRDPLTRMTDQSDGAVQDTASVYRVERGSNGQLRISRTTGRLTVYLPTTRILAGGGVETIDRGTRLAAVPAPADAVGVQRVMAKTGRWGSMRGAILSDGSRIVWHQSDAAASLRGIVFLRGNGQVTTNSGAAGVRVDLGEGWSFVAAPTLQLESVRSDTGGSATVRDGAHCAGTATLRSGQRAVTARVACVFPAKPTTVAADGRGAGAAVVQPLGSTGKWLAWIRVSTVRPTPATANLYESVRNLGVTTMRWTDAAGTHTEDLD